MRACVCGRKVGSIGEQPTFDLTSLARSPTREPKRKPCTIAKPTLSTPEVLSTRKKKHLILQNKAYGGIKKNRNPQLCKFKKDEGKGDVRRHHDHAAVHLLRVQHVRIPVVRKQTTDREARVRKGRPAMGSVNAALTPSLVRRCAVFFLAT